MLKSYAQCWEQLRLAFKITERHWRVYSKNLLSNSSATVIEPIFYVLAFGFGLGAYVTQMNGRSYLVYMAPGLAAGAAVITSFFETSYGGYFRLNFEGTYKTMLTTPIGVSAIINGEILWVAFKGAIMTSAVTLVLACFGLVHWQFIFLVPIVGVVLGVACGAIGMLATTLVDSIDQFQLYYSFIIAPLYFLSGIFFPITPEHRWVYYGVQISPLYHGVRIFQAAYWNENVGMTFLYHFPILIILAAALQMWASARFRKNFSWFKSPLGTTQRMQKNVKRLSASPPAPATPRQKCPDAL